MVHDPTAIPGTGEPSRRGVWIAAMAAILPLAALYLLAHFSVPLGQPDYLIYRYSPLMYERLLRCLPAWIMGTGIVAAAAHWEGRTVPAAPADRRRRGVPWGGWCIAVCWIGLVAWTFWAPPDCLAQHLFNLNSPAQDGAFVWEAGEVATLKDYLSVDFARRLEMTPEDMRGTRVLSNPPGTTALAYASRRAIETMPGLKRALIGALDRYDPAPGSGAEGESPLAGWPPSFPTALLFGVALTFLWGLTLPVAYGLTRAWLPPAGALAVALACAFNPSSLNFTPGKDPAQSLLVVMLLLCGLRAYVSFNSVWAAMFGVILTASVGVSLVFVWVGVVLFIGTGWDATRRKMLKPWLMRCAAPTVAGAICAWLALRLAVGFDVAATAMRVAQRYPDLQRYVIHGAYTFVGFPVFLLFAGPTFWVMLTRRSNAPPPRPSQSPSKNRPGMAPGMPPEMPPKMPRQMPPQLPPQLALGPMGDVADLASLGRTLTRACAACMVYCYFFANNNESARLWLPFLIMLMVFLSMSRAELFRADSCGLRLGRLGAASLLIAAQLVVTTLHWARMDARESEWRMTTGRNWD